ncbi:uncharacterized protein EI97DRAFT_497345 [Westerdykella ornata]|uniref:Carbohydrate-binding module family 18 protein n=1 Tax=Westerdykella ornata TaxID=318751 RepID=A0A6A6J509_WESOR|nr:uncharacterized protein EI97DRAFT_497345 [Westerdykella ornata]KAF2271267.1 hypothetical protein EI97DRAFT_497345 [Westerdykella ornata]
MVSRLSIHSLSTHSLPCLLSLLLTLSLSPLTATAADECQPSTWASAGRMRRAVVTPTAVASSSLTVANVGTVEPGQINCQYWATTKSSVNYYTCTDLAEKYGISVEVFFQLNPEVDAGCGNIQPKTKYRVEGFIEPPRATEGLCGPPNNNATCLGTEVQCCNSETWTCGDAEEDCAPDTCYEGACVGDTVYSTDGTCGYQHGNRLCAGKWGDCCNIEGACGTGSEFCGLDVCQSGNCTRPTTPTPSSTPSGDTPDGTCGGTKGYVCNVVYGKCCNRDGFCGVLPSDCGSGCQPEFGECSSKSSSRTTMSIPVTSSRSSGTTRSSLPTTTPSSTRTPSSTGRTTRSATVTGISSLPSCGQTCFKNMLAPYSALGCASPDPACLCRNVNFSYGIRDCSNGACGTQVASTVIAFGSSYCSSATAIPTPTVSGIAGLLSCGQTCFNNMMAQYSALGCASPQPACLCRNVNFGYGLRDCSNGACGPAVGSTVISFGSLFCASATAAP